MSEEEASELLGGKHTQVWHSMVELLTTYLTLHGLTWHSVGESESGPSHLGWSRLISECFKAKNNLCTFND